MKLRHVTLREPLPIAGMGTVSTLRDCETCAEGVLLVTPAGTLLFPWPSVRVGMLAAEPAAAPAPSESEALADAALDRAAEAPKPKRKR